MIDATIEPKMWNYLVKAVSTVMTEIKMMFRPDGLTVEQLSSDKSMMIGAKIPKSEFIEYNVTDEHLIILNLGEVVSIAKRLGKATEVGLSFDEDGPDSNLFQLVLTLEDNRRIFSLPILAPKEGDREVTVPFDLDYDAEFQMTGRAFDSVIEDLMILARRAKFLVEPKRVVFKGSAEGGKEAKIVYDIGNELTSLKKNTEEPDELLSSRFSLPPLDDMKGAIIEKNRTVTFKLSHNKPLWFELPIGMEDDSISRLVMLISPVVDRRTGK